MEKFNYESLNIEITRKCNMNCIHCLRGEAQNLTISTEIIDKIFEQVRDCRTISLTGGEPLLELDIIKYLIDRINSSNWNTESIQITTNGTIIDQRIIKIFEQFCSKKKNRIAYIRISADKFHNKTMSQAAYSAYSKMTNNKAIHIWTGKERIKSFKFTGKGKKYILETNDLQSFDVVSVPFLEKYQIEINSSNVLNSLYITSNGKVLLDEEVSYDDMDDICIGNIMNESLADMIRNNNKESLLNRNDWENLHTLNNHINGYMSMYLKPTFMREIYKPMLETALNAYNKLFECRKTAKKMFPYITGEDIIKHIPMPQNCLTDSLMLKMILDNFNSITNMTEMGVFKTLSELNEKRQPKI